MLIQKALGLKLASLETVAGNATFTGIGAPFGERDAAGDVLKAGIFTQSLRQSSGKLPLLWNHRTEDVLGVITASADDHVLNVAGELLIDAVAKAREIHALLKAGAIRGLSVGFIPVRKTKLADGGIEYSEGRLCEISLCAVPSYEAAQVVSVHSLGGLGRDALLALKTAIDGLLGPAPKPEPPPELELLKALKAFDPGKWARGVRR